MVDTKRDVQAEVIDILVDMTGFDRSEIKPESNLRYDLEIDSIDCLDMVFRMERILGIYVSPNDIFPSMCEPLIDGRYDLGKDRFTNNGLDYLRRTYPESVFEDRPEGYSLSDLRRVETVDMLVKNMERRIAA